jgi:hypothetical protein
MVYISIRGAIVAAIAMAVNGSRISNLIGQPYCIRARTETRIELFRTIKMKASSTTGAFEDVGLVEFLRCSSAPDRQGFQLRWEWNIYITPSGTSMTSPFVEFPNCVEVELETNGALVVGDDEGSLVLIMTG